MALVFNKKQLQSLIKIMETYELSDESEWFFPSTDENKDYFCELTIPFHPGSNNRHTPIYIKSLDR
jgi:hypothetical protein